MSGRERVEKALRRDDRPAVVSYVTGGYPDAETFRTVLEQVASESDVVELGIPFSDPMADGVTLQGAAAQALKNGATLAGLLEVVRDVDLDTPILMMSYLNPLFSYGIEQLVRDADEAGVCGFIVPDLPLEEAGLMQGPCDDAGLALVPLVTPLTPPERMARIGERARGFVYAVTRTGITGGGTETGEIGSYLQQVRERTSAPVCAGFGIRGPDDVRPIVDHVDGVIVGTALVDLIGRGDDPRPFLRSLQVPRG